MLALTRAHTTQLLTVALAWSLVSCDVGSPSVDDPSDALDLQGDAISDRTNDTENERAPSTLEIVSIEVVQNPASVLSAIVIAETSQPAKCTVQYGLDETSYDLETSPSDSATDHELVVVNMRSSQTYQMRLVCESTAGESAYSDVLAFETEALPSDIPNITVSTVEMSGMAPGVTIFGPGQPSRFVGMASPYYLAVDEAGEVVWYYRIPGNSQYFNDRSAEMLPDGNLLITTPAGFSVITVGGRVVLDVSGDELGVPRLHHDAIQLPNGRFMALSQTVEEVDVDWRDEPIRATGDVIVELDELGDVTWRWSAFDHLDDTRYPTTLSTSEGNFATYDWTHANSLFYVEDDDSVLVSLRHQNWIVKIDRMTGDVVWTLGDGGDFELTAASGLDDAAWFYAQHAAELTDDGRLIVYDNGNERPGYSESELYSRAVIYRLDEGDMTAEQVWSYVTEHYTDFLGDADVLENGNVLVTAGGPRLSRSRAQIVEVTADRPARIVWLLELDNTLIYRATRLSSFYP